MSRLNNIFEISSGEVSPFLGLEDELWSPMVSESILEINIFYIYNIIFLYIRRIDFFL